MDRSSQTNAKLKTTNEMEEDMKVRIADAKEMTKHHQQQVIAIRDLKNSYRKLFADYGRLVEKEQRKDALLAETEAKLMEAQKHLNEITAKGDADKAQRLENELKKQQVNINSLKEQNKTLEINLFKARNTNMEILSKLHKSNKRAKDLEGDLEKIKKQLVEKDNALFEEIRERRELFEKEQHLRPFKERALNAEKENKELKENFQRYKLQSDTYEKRSELLKNDLDTEKSKTNILTQSLGKKEGLINNLKFELETTYAQLENRKEEILKHRKHAEEAESEVTRRLQNEESNQKRLKRKDEENMGLRRELKSLHKTIKDFEKDKKGREKQIQKLQEKLANARATVTKMEKDNEVKMEQLAQCDKEILDAKTELDKRQVENCVLRNQVEQVKINLNALLTENKAKLLATDKELTKAKEDFSKAEIERQNLEKDIKLSKEAFFQCQRKIGHQQHAIVILQRKNEALSKKIIRLTKDALQLKLPKKTVVNVKKIAQDDENDSLEPLSDDGVIIFDDYNNQIGQLTHELEERLKLLYRYKKKIKQQRHVINILEGRNKAQAREIEILGVDSQKFHLVKETISKVNKLRQENEQEGSGTFLQDVEQLFSFNDPAVKPTEDAKKKEELQRKVGRQLDDVVLKLQESQWDIRSLKKELTANKALINAYETRNKEQENDIKKLTDELRKIKSPKKLKSLPNFACQSKCKDKSKESLQDLSGSGFTMNNLRGIRLPPLVIKPLKTNRWPTDTDASQ